MINILVFIFFHPQQDVYIGNRLQKDDVGTTGIRLYCRDQYQVHTSTIFFKWEFEGASWQGQFKKN